MKFDWKPMILLILVLSGVEVSGQKRPEGKESGGQLKIPVWAEREGSLATDLRRQDLRVMVDEKEAPIRTFLGMESPTILLLVFDTVDDLSRVDQTRELLRERLRALPANCWVGLLRSQDGLSVLQEPTADRDKLIAEIDRIQVNGKAGLLDTLEPVSQLATSIIEKSGVRIGVLYITDSGIGNYRADYLNPVINASDAGDLSRRFSDRAVQEQMTRIAQSLAGFTIPLFILHLQYRADTLNLAYQSGLERLAAATGGQTILCRTVDEITPGLQSLLTRVNTASFVSVDYPEKRRGTVRLRVEPRDTAGSSFEKLLHPTQIEMERASKKAKSR